MSTTLDDIKEKTEEHRKECLRGLLDQCTEPQKKFFARIFPEGIDNMTTKKLEDAIKLCERTIAKLWD